MSLSLLVISSPGHSRTPYSNLCIVSITGRPSHSSLANWLWLTGLRLLALLLYDWAITLPVEQDVVWSHKMNVASVLYILARVCGPLYYVSTIVLLGFVDDTVPYTPHLRLCVCWLLTGV